MFRNTAFALGLVLAAPAAFAQTAPAAEPIDPSLAYEAARNQLGILRYCQEQGFTGAEAVEAQGKLVGLLQGGDEAVGSAAEEKGAQGTVSVGGTEVSLADAVEERGSTVEATCQQIEAAVNEIAPTLPAG